jgi:hypothetical protein
MASIATTHRAAVLVETALIGLPRMLDPTGAFVFTLRPSGPAGQSLRYTCITLIGLTAAVRAGLSPRLDVERLVRALAERRQQITNLGELGLLLWCLSEHYQAPAPVYDEIVDRIPAGPGRLGALTSTELGWLVTGLTRIAEIAPSRRDVRDKARAAYAALRANYSESTGLFCYGGRAGGRLRRRLRRRFGFFDNQVYGIRAGVSYARVFADPAALAMAEGCLERIVEAQGPLGQWAWHYDVRTGAVVDRYPVYAVHQHGMAPLALNAVTEATGRRFDEVLEPSLAWVFGENELGQPLLDGEHSVIWRSIRRRIAHGKLVHVFKLLSLLGLPGVSDRLAETVNAPGQLDVDMECRPYELGWLLLALVRR